jgi:hypothetical protein
MNLRKRIAVALLLSCVIVPASVLADSKGDADLAKTAAMTGKSNATSKKTSASNEGASATTLYYSLPAAKGYWTQAQKDLYNSYINTGVDCMADAVTDMSNGDYWFGQANGDVDSGDYSYGIGYYLVAKGEYDDAYTKYYYRHIGTPGDDDAYTDYDSGLSNYTSAYNWFTTALAYYYMH